LVRQVQPHEVQAKEPDTKRLVVAGEDRPGQVIEPPAAAMALVAPAVRLGLIPAVLGNLGGAARGAPHAVGPTHRPDGLKAPGGLDEGLDVDHRRSSLGTEPSVATIWLSRRVYPREDAAGITRPESRMSLSGYGLARRDRLTALTAVSARPRTAGADADGGPVDPAGRPSQGG